MENTFKPKRLISVSLRDIQTYLTCPQRLFLQGTQPTQVLSFGASILADAIKAVYLYRTESQRANWGWARLKLDWSFKRHLRATTSTDTILNLYDRMQKWWYKDERLEEFLPNMPLLVSMGGIQLDDLIDLSGPNILYEFTESPLTKSQFKNNLFAQLRGWAWQLQTGYRLTDYRQLFFGPTSIETIRLGPAASLEEMNQIVQYNLAGLRNGFFPPVISEKCFLCAVKKQCEDKAFFGE